MPSKSKLFFWLVFSLVARCAKAKREVALFCSSTGSTANVLSGPLLQCVLHSMRSRCDKRQIFNIVIKSISIFVMYVHTLGRVCYDSVLIFPFVWLCNFYAYIQQAVPRFVQSFSANRELFSYFRKNLLANVLCRFRECFSSALRATWCVVIGVAVKPFSPYDLRTAKRAKFKGKFFGHGVFYAKQNRIANAF